MNNFKRFEFPWLKYKHIQKLLNVFADKNEQIRFVGGCVRDSIISGNISDIDAATPISPDNIIRILENAGIRAIPTAIEHGTITAIIDGYPVEITTLRRDDECFGRTAKVVFTDSWQEDAARRDFTINAIFVDGDGKIYDYFGGEQDISIGKLRFIGDANIRIKEDYLRILRYFRFISTYNFAINDDILQACKANISGINQLSNERITSEILKLLAGKNIKISLEKMQNIGLLQKIIPHANIGYLNNIISDKSIISDKLAIIRLSLLSNDVPVKMILSNKDRELFKLLKDYNSLLDEKIIRNIIKRYGAEYFSYILTKLLIINVIKKIDEQNYLNIADNLPIFPVNGKDLLKIGIKSGKNMGNILQDLEEYWEDQNYLPIKMELLQKINYEK